MTKSRRAPATRHHGRREKVLAATLIPTLFFAALEVVARLAEPRDDVVGVTPANVEATVPAWLVRDPSLSVTLGRIDRIPAGIDAQAVFRFWHFYRRDSDLHYRLKPGLDAWTVNTVAPRELAEPLRWHLTSNADGFRGPPLPAAAPAGTRLVVCLGDSSTYGWGVGESEAFPARLTSLLDVADGVAWHVINLGHPGYTSWQGRILIDRVAALHPAAVVISYGTNDAAEAGITDRELWRRDHSVPARIASFAEHSALYRTLRRALLAAWNPDARNGGRDRPLVLRVPPAEYSENLSIIIDKARAAGAVPIVLAVTRPRGYADILQRVAHDKGAFYRDAGPLLEEALPDLKAGRRYPAEVGRIMQLLGGTVERDPEFLVKVDPVHPNRIGHDLIARDLARVIGANATTVTAGR